VPTSVSADNIVVTVGAVGALSSAVRAVVDAGDDVLIPNPGWPNYIAMVRCAGAEPRPRRRPDASGEGHTDKHAGQPDGRRLSAEGHGDGAELRPGS
jgi:aspartate/methionine/tyrosine aminotransferase